MYSNFVGNEVSEVLEEDLLSIAIHMKNADCTLIENSGSDHPRSPPTPSSIKSQGQFSEDCRCSSSTDQKLCIGNPRDLVLGFGDNFNARLE
jgi:hypothetical protein